MTNEPKRRVLFSSPRHVSERAIKSYYFIILYVRWKSENYMRFLFGFYDCNHVAQSMRNEKKRHIWNTLCVRIDVYSCNIMKLLRRIRIFIKNDEYMEVGKRISGENFFFTSSIHHIHLPCILITDACERALGSILCQLDEENS